MLPRALNFRPPMLQAKCAERLPELGAHRWRFTHGHGMCPWERRNRVRESLLRRPLAGRAIAEAGMPERGPHDAPFPCAWHTEGCRGAPGIPGDEAGVPAAALQLHERALDDRLAVQSLGSRLITYAGSIEGSDF